MVLEEYRGRKRKKLLFHQFFGRVPLFSGLDLRELDLVRETQTCALKTPKMHPGINNFHSVARLTGHQFPEMCSRNNIRWILRGEVTLQLHLEMICICWKLQIRVFMKSSQKVVIFQKNNCCVWGLFWARHSARHLANIVLKFLDSLQG